jgi:hypothetical protein
MVFMGGKVVLPRRKGFSNRDRSAADRPWRAARVGMIGGASATGGTVVMGCAA